MLYRRMENALSLTTERNKQKWLVIFVIIVTVIIVIATGNCRVALLKAMQAGHVESLPHLVLLLPWLVELHPLGF